MDVRLRQIVMDQLGLVARWQMLALGMSVGQADSRAWRHRWTRVHDGVYSVVGGPLTAQQRWLAACLTAPGTMLAGPSAAACWGFVNRDPAVVSVVRSGSGGPRHLDGVRVSRSATVVAEVDWHRGIPVTSAERTLIDLAPHLGPDALARATREAIRLRVVTAASLLDALARHRGRRGTARLRLFAERYAHLPIARTRSDAEGVALERLFLAGAALPAVNERVAGFEADLVDHDRRLIVEIDGPQFHLFPDEDARRDAAWQEAGFAVVRIPTTALYD